MDSFVPFILCYTALLFFHNGASLRCRSGNQQMDAQFQKVLKICKNRYAGLSADDSMSMEDSSSESDSSSEEYMYDKDFLNKKNDRRSYNQSNSNQRYGNSDKNSNMNNYSSNHSINGNVRDTRMSNDRDLWNAHNRRSDFNNADMNNEDMHFNNADMNNEDKHFNNNTGRESACIIQCFFNELNAVDQKGFPDKDQVIPLMSQNIQDPELKDFVEESIIECFRYLESNKQEKCEFSQNLLTCLAEKGQQNCEDWKN
ncbi:odorant-binding protein 59a [Xylocopa sonorina]|uniref:odorant-binding protein 59a n=1 Tax=Xylocopa sonorina TaxID=1818115 RepID=UPI00403A7D03